MTFSLAVEGSCTHACPFLVDLCHGLVPQFLILGRVVCLTLMRVIEAAEVVVLRIILMY